MRFQHTITRLSSLYSQSAFEEDMFLTLLLTKAFVGNSRRRASRLTRCRGSQTPADTRSVHWHCDGTRVRPSNDSWRALLMQMEVRAAMVGHDSSYVSCLSSSCHPYRLTPINIRQAPAARATQVICAARKFDMLR